MLEELKVALSLSLFLSFFPSTLQTYLIHRPACIVIALQCVAVNQSQMLPNGNAPSSLFTGIGTAIFHVHIPQREVASTEIEVSTVQ